MIHQIVSHMSVWVRLGYHQVGFRTKYWRIKPNNKNVLPPGSVSPTQKRQSPDFQTGHLCRKRPALWRCSLRPWAPEWPQQPPPRLTCRITCTSQRLPEPPAFCSPDHQASRLVSERISESASEGYWKVCAWWLQDVCDTVLAFANEMASTCNIWIHKIQKLAGHFS